MRRFFALTVAALLLSAIPAMACPNCKDAVESGSTAEENGDDPLREARAYNNSIYLMLSVPYALLGGLGFYGYRQIKRVQR